MRYASLPLALVICAALTGCSEDEGGGAQSCDTEPVVMATSAGVDFVRTPDSCFNSLPD